MRILWGLFWSFFKVGLFTFGGGAAMLPLLQAEFVDRRHWVSEDELLDFYSIGQCTPGIIALNTATFIGYKKQGIKGAIMSTLGVVTPSLVIILLVASLLKNYMQNPYVIHAFSGIRLVAIALIADALWKLWKKAVNSRWGQAIFTVSLVLLVLANFSPAMIVLCAGVFGISYQFYARRRQK